MKKSEFLQFIFWSTTWIIFYHSTIILWKLTLKFILLFELKRIISIEFLLTLKGLNIYLRNKFRLWLNDFIFGIFIEVLNERIILLRRWSRSVLKYYGKFKFFIWIKISFLSWSTAILFMNFNRIFNASYFHYRFLCFNFNNIFLWNVFFFKF